MSEIYPIFTYGTLRVGEGGWQWTRGCVLEHSLDATTSGHIWFAHVGGYPVAKFDSLSSDVIYGDVLWCDVDHPLYERMVSMEFGAGYDMREIEVRLNDHRVIEAFGFHYLRKPNPDLFIASGDWKRAFKECCS